MKLGTDTEVDYQHAAYGTWGEFTTSAGQVQFLETKARLGQSGIDKESRLTKLLLPVREILDLKQLDFNQLLQRDLDDHRVAQKLVPYVLRSCGSAQAMLQKTRCAKLSTSGLQCPKVSFIHGLESARLLRYPPLRRAEQY